MLTDRELALFTCGNYRLFSILREIAREITTSGGDLSLLPDVVTQVVEMVVNSITETEDDNDVTS